MFHQMSANGVTTGVTNRNPRRSPRAGCIIGVSKIPIKSSIPVYDTIVLD